MFGDYEFLSAMFGISGAAGRHPCLWCEITNDQMQLSYSIRANNMPNKRSLENLKTRHGEFIHNCNSKLSLAKTVFNVMDNIFFEIPLDQVCLPGLHITMGIFLKIFADIIERYCAEFDHLINADNCYYKVNKIRSDLLELEERHDLIKNEIDWYSVLHNDGDVINEYQECLDAVIKDIHEKEEQLHEIEMGASADDIGPCVKSLDETLKQIGVERQAYYSNTITGNHCHVLMKPNNIDILCNSVPVIFLQEVGETPAYRDCLLKFSVIKDLLNYYSKCHNMFNVARYITIEEILQFRQDVTEFMSYLRVHFSHIRITPKLHMLEDHMYDFLWKWRTGCGLYGEQGGESAHNGINKMKHRYYNIKNDLTRLNYIMNQHLLSTNPKAQVIKPKKKTRNLKRKTEC